MRKEKTSININKIVYIVISLFFIGGVIRLSYLCLFDYKVGEVTISAFISNRNTIE